MDITKLISLIIDGLQIDGEHHKQWYLEEILKYICDLERLRNEYEWERGIAP